MKKSSSHRRTVRLKVLFVFLELVFLFTDFSYCESSHLYHTCVSSCGSDNQANFPQRKHNLLCIQWTYYIILDKDLAQILGGKNIFLRADRNWGLIRRKYPDGMIIHFFFFRKKMTQGQYFLSRAAVVLRIKCVRHGNVRVLQ